MSEQPSGAEHGLLALYDRALPSVYGYLRARCDTRTLAEDLSAETFLAAVDAMRRPNPPPLDVGWLIGVARHKLADHWRQRAREVRNLRAVGPDPDIDDPWDVQLDALRARAVLAELAPQHRAVLTLRYLDDLPVRDVAELVGRSVHATEGLLVRARAAFRRSYESDPGEEVDQ